MTTTIEETTYTVTRKAVQAPADEPTTGPGGGRAVEAEQRSENTKPARPWFSGWCGPNGQTRCNDEHRHNKAGEVVRLCRYLCENGEKAARRFVYCACACHADPERAGQAVAVNN